MHDLILEPAVRDDLPFILALLQDDAVTPAGDDVTAATDPAYQAAFSAIDADPNQTLFVAWQGGERVGTFQIGFTPGLARRGAWRATMESVHVAPSRRSEGIGAEMMDRAIAIARDRDCAVIQLTSNKARTRAHGFYERLGFARSHEGFKLYL